MEIENMHPFCLPFGLCHDATSSTALDTTSNSGQQNLDGRLSSSSPALSKEMKLSGQRSKNASPSDELFRQLNSTISSSTTILGQSLLNHHDLIGHQHQHHSSLNDIIGDGSFYSSLGSADDHDHDDDGMRSGHDPADDRLRKSSILTDIDAFTDCCGKLEEEDHEEEEEAIDWYYGEYSLFSPTRRKSSSLSASARAAIRATNLFHHQVFQHLVDPIDIKSSPTLAQLNLNSTDNDPMDVFWDSTTTPSSATATSAASALGNNKSAAIAASHSAPTTNHHHLHTDLPSNCTSINKSSGSSCCSRTILSNHLQHTSHHELHQPICNNNNLSQQQHNTNQRTQQTNTTHYPAAIAHLTSSCPHQQQQQQQSSYQQQQQQQQCRCHHTAALQSSTICSGHLAPRQSCACQHNAATATTSNGSNLRPTSTALNELNQQQQPPNNNNASLGAEQQTDQKRASSPALVTSSSSPLSSSAASTPAAGGNATVVGQLQQQPVLGSGPVAAAAENNKLKENIEYLTALLCNGGNKLEPVANSSSHQHQAASSISSTMARSYTTLAHTLSTGPKLFETRTLPTTANNPTNEAAPCLMDANGFMKRPQQHQQVLNQQMQQMQQPQWVKVESSISAADSTGETAYHDCAMHQQQQQRPLADMRVLSSLLAAGNGPLPATQPLSSAAAANKCPENCIHVSGPPSHSPWPQAVQQQQQQQQQQHHLDPAMMQPNVEVQRPSIPPNGRPITLTPIASHNNPILQQQQQQQQQAARVKLSPFVQPASPSASSTASSCANTSDIGSSASSSGPTIKKPRLSSTTTTTVASRSPAKKKQSAAGGNSRARPSSMSTECSSLSSHDEGFSSQLESATGGGGGGGDESNLGGDSDHEDDNEDDDDVDSDDESFYGDYTNNDLIGASISDDAENKWTLNMGRTRRNGQKRFFWQYNVQSKGPKGSRMCSSDAAAENPFVLPEASDPVFSQDCQVEGVKHSGKARRGDGNDLTPNPRKLLMIGLELKKLGKIINELAPVTDLPINARTKTRKEKNKLASRACRLKKKAQHEANKIKLYGLQREHQQVVLAIYDVRKLLNQALALKDNAVSQGHQQQPLKASGDNQQACANNNGSQFTVGDGNTSLNVLQQSTTTATTVASIAEQCSMRVAGQTSDFVNSVLEKVVSGCIDGGLEA